MAVSLMLTAGCKKDELRAKDARIAELEAQGAETGASFDQCKKDRENLNKLVKGYTGEINAMEAALAEASGGEASGGEAAGGGKAASLACTLAWVGDSTAICVDLTAETPPMPTTPHLPRVTSSACRRSGE